MQDGDVEGRLLPLQVFLAVVLGEGDLDLPGLTLLHADQLLFEAGNELARADGQVRMVGAAALERLALDLALEGKPEPVAIGNHALVALVLVAAVLAEHALNLGVDVLVGDLDHRLLDLDTLEVHQGDGRQHLVADVEGEVGLTFEHAVDLGLVLGEVDLGLHRGALGALVERLLHRRVDRVGHDFGHRRTAIDLLEVSHRHLAGAETLQVRLPFDLIELGIEPLVEILGRDDHGEFALEALVEGFGDLHWGIPCLVVSFGRGG